MLALACISLVNGISNSCFKRVKMFMIQAAPRDLAPTDSPTTDTPSTDGTIATPVVNAGRKRRDVEGLVKTTDAERLRDEPPSGAWRPDLSDVCRL